MSLLSASPDRVAEAEQDFIERVRARQLRLDTHMAAEGIGGPPPTPSQPELPQLMSLSFLTVMGEAVLKTVLTNADEREIATTLSEGDDE